MDKRHYEFRRLTPRAEQSRETRVSEKPDQRAYQLTQITTFNDGVQQIQRLPQIYTSQERLLILKEIKHLKKEGFAEAKLSPETIAEILAVQPDPSELRRQLLHLVPTNTKIPEPV